MIISRQKDFARKDYEGLNKAGKEALKKKRGEIAKKLLEDRSSNNSLRDDIITQSALMNSGRGTEFFDKFLGVDPDSSVKFTKKEQEALANNKYFKKDVERTNAARNILSDLSIKSANNRAEAARKEVLSDQAKKLKESISKHEAKAKELKKIKNIKRGAAAVAGTAAVTGTAYAGKKAYDHFKNKKDQSGDNNKK